MTDKTSLRLSANALRLRLWRSGAPYYNLAIREGVRRVFPPARPRPKSAARRARVVGLLSTATGIGQSARLCIDDLRQSGYALSTHNLSKLFGVDGKVPFNDCGRASSSRDSVSIYHLNPPLMMLGMLMAGPRRYYSGPNVAFWAWELPELPPEWIVALDYVDAVLTPSAFCRDIIKRYTEKPVIVVPHPVAQVRGRDRPVDTPGRPFRALTVFNCGSSLYRKNPFAAVEAFKRAFGDNRDAELILKVSDGRQHETDLRDLRERIGGAPNIHVMDSMMTTDELDALVRTADVYISLHRSEGFGLTVAEAIMREVPVVVTGWSGTADFCPPDLAHVVDFEMVPLNDPHPAYCHVRSSSWADPSVEVAARRLVEVREDPEASHQRAVKLRSRLIAHIEANRYDAALDRLFAGPAAQSATG